jgi:hypothetical protein
MSNGRRLLLFQAEYSSQMSHGKNFLLLLCLNDSLETLAEWGVKYAAEHDIMDRYIM